MQELYYAGALAAGCAVVYASNTEPVPISNRSHLVLVSPQKEKQLGTIVNPHALRSFIARFEPRP